MNLIMVGTSRCDVPARASGRNDSALTWERPGADGAARRPHQVQGFKARMLRGILTMNLSWERRSLAGVSRFFSKNPLAGGDAGARRFMGSFVSFPKHVLGP